MSLALVIVCQTCLRNWAISGDLSADQVLGVAQAAAVHVCKVPRP